MNEEIFALAEVKERLDGDREFFLELTDVFFDELVKLLADLEKGIAVGSGDDVQKAAHSLKSASGNLGAKRVYNLFFELERIGKEEKLDDALPRLEETKSAIEQFREIVSKVRAGEIWE